MARSNNLLRLVILANLALVTLLFYVYFSLQNKKPAHPENDAENLSEPPRPQSLSPEQGHQQVDTYQPRPKKQPAPTPPIDKSFPANPHFATYASPNQTIDDDLQAVQRSLEAFWAFLKDPDALSVRSNASIMKTLTGQNREGIPFIPPENAYLNENGELLDRWGTPLDFHPLSLTEIEIRSAGPDRELFTEDDTILCSE